MVDHSTRMTAIDVLLPVLPLLAAAHHAAAAAFVTSVGAPCALHRRGALPSALPLAAPSSPPDESPTTRPKRSVDIKTYDPTVDFTSPPSVWPFDSASDMDRDDESDDSDFYGKPRLVKHVDEWAVLSLTSFYREELTALAQQRKGDNLDVLDLCSSWVSHLPPEDGFTLGNVAGLGMNKVELEANDRLDSFSVQDLNVNPSLGQYSDGSFDVVLIALSVDYLVKPREVFREMNRVLRPGGVALITYGNRYFRKKAISSWLRADERGRMDIVASYFYHCGSPWTSIEAVDIKLKKSSDAVMEFVQNQDLFRWFATAIFRGTWATDDIFAVKAVK